MSLYKVYFKLRFTESARTMNLDYPSESAAIAALVRQGTISSGDAREVVIRKIERC